MLRKTLWWMIMRGRSLAGVGWLIVPALQDLREEDRKFKATWATE